MFQKIPHRLKIAIVASLVSLAILLLVELAGVIPSYIHVFPASLGLVLFIFVLCYFLPFA